MLSTKSQAVFTCLFVLLNEFSNINCSNALTRKGNDRKLSLLNAKMKSPDGVDQVLTPPPTRNSKSSSAGNLMNVSENDSSDGEFDESIFEMNLGPATVPSNYYIHQAIEKKQEYSKKTFGQEDIQPDRWDGPIKKQQLKSQDNLIPKFPSHNNNSIGEVRPNLTWSAQYMPTSPYSNKSSDTVKQRKIIKRRKDGKENDYMGGFPGSEDPQSEEDDDYEEVYVSSDSSDSDEYLSGDEEKDELIKLPSGHICYKPMNNPILAEKIRNDNFNGSYHSFDSESEIFRDVDSVKDESDEMMTNFTFDS